MNAYIVYAKYITLYYMIYGHIVRSGIYIARKPISYIIIMYKHKNYSVELAGFSSSPRCASLRRIKHVLFAIFVLSPRAVAACVEAIASGSSYIIRSSCIRRRRCVFRDGFCLSRGGGVGGTRVITAAWWRRMGRKNYDFGGNKAAAETNYSE